MKLAEYLPLTHNWCRDQISKPLVATFDNKYWSWYSYYTFFTLATSGIKAVTNYFFPTQAIIAYLAIGVFGALFQGNPTCPDQISIECKHPYLALSGGFFNAIGCNLLHNTLNLYVGTLLGTVLNIAISSKAMCLFEGSINAIAEGKFKEFAQKKFQRDDCCCLSDNPSK